MYREKKRVIGDDFNLVRAFEPCAGRVFDAEFLGDAASIVVRVPDGGRHPPVAARDDGGDLRGLTVAAR
jgi:hypothetical protein